MSKQIYVLEVNIPEGKCPNIKNKAKFISEGRANVWLSINTTSADAENGITRYGVTGGNNVRIFTESDYEKNKQEIDLYLTDRFGDDWSSQLKACK